MSSALQVSAASSSVASASTPSEQLIWASMRAEVERLIQARVAAMQPLPNTERQRVLAQNQERVALRHLAMANSTNYAERASVLQRLSTVFELAERQQLALSASTYRQAAELFGALRPWPTLRGSGVEGARNYARQLMTYAVSAALTCNPQLGRWGLMALAERDRTIAACKLTPDDLGLRGFKTIDVLRDRLVSLAARAQ